MEAEGTKEKAEGIREKAKDLVNDVNEYVETVYQLSVLKLTKRVTEIASVAIIGVAFLVFGMFFILFGSVALALWLGHLMGSLALGFIVVAGFYLLDFLIILAIRRKIVFPYFRNLLIRKFYD